MKTPLLTSEVGFCNLNFEVLLVSGRTQRLEPALPNLRT
jgi:hypothetical protein